MAARAFSAEEQLIAKLRSKINEQDVEIAELTRLFQEQSALVADGRDTINELKQKLGMRADDDDEFSNKYHDVLLQKFMSAMEAINGAWNDRLIQTFPIASTAMTAAILSDRQRSDVCDKIAQFLAPAIGWDERYYLDQHPDVRSSRLNSMIHYLTYGMFEGRAWRAADMVTAEKCFSMWRSMGLVRSIKR